MTLRADSRILIESAGGDDGHPRVGHEQRRDRATHGAEGALAIRRRNVAPEALLSAQPAESLQLMNNSSAGMIFGDAGFLSSITEAPPLPLPALSQLANISSEEEEELSIFLETDLPLLTNTAYNTDESNSPLIPEPQQELILPMTNSSIERLINTLHTPTISMESLTNHSKLINSAVGSSCAKQHSNSSEDDSLPPKCTNPYVC